MHLLFRAHQNFTCYLRTDRMHSPTNGDRDSIVEWRTLRNANLSAWCQANIREETQYIRTLIDDLADKANLVGGEISQIHLLALLNCPIQCWNGIAMWIDDRVAECVGNTR